MEIADGRSVRDTGREVKRTDRLTLNIDKFILLDQTEARKLVKSKRKKVLDKRLPIWYNPTC